MPVIYSILPLKEEETNACIRFEDFKLRPSPVSDGILIDSRSPVHTQAIHDALAAQSNRTRVFHTFNDGTIQILLRKSVKTGVGLDGVDSLEGPGSSAMAVDAHAPITVEYEAQVVKSRDLRATLLIHQYDDMRQISAAKFSLKSGSFKYQLFVDEGTRSIRLSLRLAGEGGLILNWFRIMQRRLRTP